MLLTLKNLRLQMGEKKRLKSYIKNLIFFLVLRNICHIILYNGY